METLRLKANPSHPTYKKIQRIIGLLENVQITLEWINGKLKIRDHEYGVSFDVVDIDTNKPLDDMPPLFEFKLTRNKIPIRNCRCVYCGHK